MAVCTHLLYTLIVTVQLSFLSDWLEHRIHPGDTTHTDITHTSHTQSQMLSSGSPTKNRTFISIPAVKRVLSIQKTCELNIPSSQRHYLSAIQPCAALSPVTLQPYLHPHIIEASKMLYGVLPWELTEEQTEHFRGFQEYKIQNGRPIEDNLVYKPMDWKIPINCIVKTLA